MDWREWLFFFCVFLGIVFALTSSGILDKFADKEDSRSGFRPPTDRQLDYIDALIDERDADDLADCMPRTIQEASALITELEQREYRDYY